MTPATQGIALRKGQLLCWSAGRMQVWSPVAPRTTHTSVSIPCLLSGQLCSLSPNSTAPQPAAPSGCTTEPEDRGRQAWEPYSQSPWPYVTTWYTHRVGAQTPNNQVVIQPILHPDGSRRSIGHRPQASGNQHAACQVPCNLRHPELGGDPSSLPPAPWPTVALLRSEAAKIDAEVHTFGSLPPIRPKAI